MLNYYNKGIEIQYELLKSNDSSFEKRRLAKYLSFRHYLFYTYKNYNEAMEDCSNSIKYCKETELSFDYKLSTAYLARYQCGLRLGLLDKSSEDINSFLSIQIDILFNEYNNHNIDKMLSIYNDLGEIVID